MPLYTVEKKTANAAYPRKLGSTPFVSDRLKVVYNKYKTTQSIPEDAIRVNLIFLHGVGFNKAVYKYHINWFYELAKKNGWYLDVAIAIDIVNHGDSAVENKGKIGWAYHWDDCARDIIEVIRHENITLGDLENNTYSKNILIGHSMGGHSSLVAGFIYPLLFDSLIVLDPVVFRDEAKRIRPLELLNKLEVYLQDNFESEEDMNCYYKEYSFFKTIRPDILDDFLKDEIYTSKDPETGETIYHCKTTVRNQMICYHLSPISIPPNMATMAHITIPVCHMIPSMGKWNLPESVVFVRNTIPKAMLTAIDVKVGGHLFNMEEPDAVLEPMGKYVEQRVKLAKAKLSELPEIIYNGDREKIVETQYKRVTLGDILAYLNNPAAKL